MTRGKNIVLQCIILFLLFVLFWKFGKKTAFFFQFQNLRLGVCLAMCLKFAEFEAGCAYELYAYKKKNV